METLRALEDALLEFAGSILVTSHDRWFLDRICTHLLAFEGNSEVTFLKAIIKNMKPKNSSDLEKILCDLQEYVLNL